jgi:hypothetical protein
MTPGAWARVGFATVVRLFGLAKLEGALLCLSLTTFLHAAAFSGDLIDPDYG